VTNSEQTHVNERFWARPSYSAHSNSKMSVEFSFTITPGIRISFSFSHTHTRARRNLNVVQLALHTSTTFIIHKMRSCRIQLKMTGLQSATRLVSCHDLFCWFVTCQYISRGSTRNATYATQNKQSFQQVIWSQWVFLLVCELKSLDLSTVLSHVHTCNYVAATSRTNFRQFGNV